jgi:hypothetical protein
VVQAYCLLLTVLLKSGRVSLHWRHCCRLLLLLLLLYHHCPSQLQQQLLPRGLPQLRNSLQVLLLLVAVQAYHCCRWQQCCCQGEARQPCWRAAAAGCQLLGGAGRTGLLL